MDSAFTRFFNIPELIAELASLLYRNEVSCLMQTSRTLCHVFEPFLYHQLELRKASQSRLVSAASFQALARNTHHVRRWDTIVYDTAYVYSGLIAYQKQSGHFASSSAPGPPGSPSSWLPTPESMYAEIIPMPPMSNLNKLHMVLVLHRMVKEQPYPHMYTFNVQRSLLQACWIIQSCPILVELVLDEVILSSSADYQALAASLNKLTRLVNLQLTIAPWDDFAWQCYSTIFFACPSSLQTLRMPVVYYPRIHENHRTVNENLEMLLNGPSEQRDVPLTDLKTFGAGKIYRDTSVDDIIAIFAHCLNIEHLYLPDVSERSDVDEIARIIVNACPRLSILYLYDDYLYENSGGYNGNRNVALLNSILKLMPAQQAAKIRFPITYETLDPQTMSGLFKRHSSTLCSLDFSSCLTIPSKVLQVVFQECFALEELRTHRKESEPRYITLEDAVSVDWVCLRLRCIEIEIGIELSPTFLSDEKPYCRRLPPIVLSEEETRLFGLLEQLYRRLGALTELEEVHLRAMGLGTNYSTSGCLRYYFPGFLIVGDRNTERPGYLDLLRRWEELRTLEESARAVTGQGKATLDVGEAACIGEHWLAFRTAMVSHEYHKSPKN